MERAIERQGRERDTRENKQRETERDREETEGDGESHGRIAWPSFGIAWDPPWKGEWGLACLRDCFEVSIDVQCMLSNFP